MQIGDIKNHDDALQYLRNINANPDEVGFTTKIDEETKDTYKVRKKISKLTHSLAKRDIYVDDMELARDLRQRTASTHEFGTLIPNDFTSPLSIQQKEYIRDNLQHISIAKIASFVLTNPQNVRMALNGAFSSTAPPNKARWSKDQPSPVVAEIAPLPVIDREYGPLTLAEKVYIQDHHQDTRIADLARVYNTSTTNISLAVNGQYKRPSDALSPAQMLEALLTLTNQGYSIVLSKDIVDDDIGITLDHTFNRLMKGETL